MAAAKPHAFFLGRWRVDPSLDEISLDGNVVKLEPRLMGLLLSLAARPGEVVSHQTLLDEVWRDVIVSSDSVYQAVGALRRILGDVSKDPTYIANLPRRGYRLIAPVTPASSPAPAAPTISIAPPGKPEPLPPTSRRTAVRRPLVLSIALGAALLSLVAGRAWLRSHTAGPAAALFTPEAPTGKSIAVLPFVDMSATRDQEYFSDGLSEELIDKLSHSANLKVIARTSSFQFKGKSEDMRTIGQKLGVANLLEGSVRTSGKTLRVTAQLIKVSDGSHLWSESYDRGMGDVFRLQDEIATAVVAALQTTMTMSRSAADGRPVNIEAYNAILRGRYFYRKHTQQDSERAVGSFEEALRLDPNDADAWVDLAAVYDSRLGTGWQPPGESYALARSAVDRALAIDPNLANAHFILGALEWDFHFDIPAAQAQFRRARELDPGIFGPQGTPTPMDSTIALLNDRGDQAVIMLQRIVERDPLRLDNLERLASALFANNRLPEAERTLRNLLTLEPRYAGAHCDLGEVLLARNQPDAALTVMTEEPDQTIRPACVSDALWKLGRRKQADELLLGAASKYANSAAYALAESYALRNDRDQAINWLKRAQENREASVIVMAKWDPLLRNLHEDPRFAALLHTLKLPVQ